MSVKPPHQTAALSIAIRTAWPWLSPNSSWPGTSTRLSTSSRPPPR